MMTYWNCMTYHLAAAVSSLVCRETLYISLRGRNAAAK